MARTLPFPNQQPANNPPVSSCPLAGKRLRSGSTENYQSITEVIKLPDVDKKGGFFKVNVDGGDGGVSCEIFIFPVVGNLAKSDKDKTLKVFTSKLYKLTSADNNQIDSVLSRIVNKESSEDVWSKSLNKAVKNIPANSLGRKVELSAKQAGPRLPQLESIHQVHTELNTLKVERFLNLPDKKARFLRSAAILPLAPEHKVKKFRELLLGGEGDGFVEVKKLSLLKWYRKMKNEVENKSPDGTNKRIEIVWGFIPPTETKAALEHWCSVLHSHNQLMRLDSDPNCPEELKGRVVCTVTGPDSGKGYTRLGLRIVNRQHSNTGSKTFVLGLVNMSDKNFSNFQSQNLIGLPLKSIQEIQSLKVKVLPGSPLASQQVPNISHQHLEPDTSHTLPGANSSPPRSAPVPPVPGSSALPTVPGSSAPPTVPGSSHLPTVPESSPLPTVPASSPLPTVPGSSPLPTVPGSSPLTTVPGSGSAESLPDTWRHINFFSTDFEAHSTMGRKWELQKM